MNGYGRYGAFLFLAAVFLSVSYLRLSKYPTSISETKGPAASLASAPAAAALSAPAPAPKHHQPRKLSRETALQLPIDINSATKEELMTLPGIGPVTADRIIEKRLELGGFGSVEELTEVKWIGKVKLERLRGLVTVKNGPSKAQAPLSTPQPSVERETD